MLDKRRLLAALSLLYDLLALSGENPFRIKAFEHAIRILDALPEVELSRRVARRTLIEVSGIGAGIADLVETWARTGTIPELEVLRAAVPAGVIDLLRVPGLGPRRVAALHGELGVSSLDDLEDACRQNRLVDIKGFGEKSQARVLEGVEAFKRYRGWYLLPVGALLGRELAAKVPRGEGTLEVVGSVARRREVVRDLDLLWVGGLDVHALADRLGLRVEGTRPDGAVRLEGADLPVDVHAAKPEAAVVERLRLCATPEAWKILSDRAWAEGWDLGRSRFTSDVEAFDALGLPPIPPELLEDAWSLRAAESGALLDVVTASDLKGNLHTHTTWSDGRDPVAGVAAQAAVLGHRYLGITDHSRSAHYAGGLQPAALAAQGEELSRAGDAFPDLVLFHGVESDILADGSLDYPDEVLDRLDYVVASIHSRFEMPGPEMTARVLAAIAHPKTAILGHPTGRLLLQREPFAIDVEAVLQACLRHRVAIELNTNAQRLDLDWRYLRRARELGVVVAIDSDAHDAAALGDVEWGVASAIKAALPRSQVLNTWPPGRVAAFFRKRG